jgi:Excinuclease ATPase subunit
MNEYIKIINARQNNLKNVSVDIPKHKITAVTGVSGSGKSSLVFDTLAAESRRELNDTFSSYVQSYLPKYGRPDVDRIENLPVAIVIDQKKVSANSRSTVGTYTDLYTFFRLLFSRVGQPFIGYSDSFSFNHPDGKCPTCDGLGQVNDLDIHKLIDFDKSLNEDPIDFPTFQYGNWRWKRYATSGLFDLDKKIKDYNPKELDLFLNSPQIKIKNPPKDWPHTALYEGIIPRMTRSIIHTDEGKRHQKQLDKFVSTKTCPSCQGSRVNDRVRSCKINDKSIADIVELPLDELQEFLTSITNPLAIDIKNDLKARITSLIDIGLSYLTLARSTETLSGGEAQRIKIAKYINSSLNDIIYILDEPSAGLHPQDIKRINSALVFLKEKGDTVILVEHNPQMIEIADNIIDMGPLAGTNGGQIQFVGDYQNYLKANTITSKFLRKPIKINKNVRTSDNFIHIKNSNLHNLKNITVNIPLNNMTVLCGVAGSGKSSLAQEIYKQALAENLEIIHISQKTIGVNLRSTPLTYLNIFDKIRKLFSQENKVSPALFSYNSKGACPHCKGKGIIVSEMAFMDNITSVCELCHGHRYSQDVLKYTYHGKNISQILDMTIKEAINFFSEDSFNIKLKNLQTVGLDYIKLNQSLSTLSGGELQRLKLADNLQTTNTIYLLDEPTDGLNLSDMDKILELFKKLVAQGNSLIILEHHISMILEADWIIELGPEGGNKGGFITFTGTPQELLASKNSLTASYLNNLK